MTKSNLISYKSKIAKKKQTLLGLLFILPAALVLIVFKYIPIVQCIFQSFFQYNITDLPGNFVGLDNYKTIFSSDLFFTYLKNSILLYVYGTIFGFFTPFIQALLLFQLKRSRGFFRYMYILPMGITSLAGLSIWKYVWEPSGGLANFITESLGIGTFKWLYDENLVKFCLRFPHILGGGMAVVMYLVTMNNVPNEQIEAAKIDGANGWQIMLRITIPGVKFMLKIQFLLSLVSSLLAFEDVYILTQGGPGYSSTTLILGAYIKSFREQNFGVAMAISVVTLILTLTITIFVYKWQSRGEVE